MGIEFDTGFPAQVIHGLGVFPSAECKIITLARFKGFQPVNGNLYFVMGSKQGLLNQNLPSPHFLYQSTIFTSNHSNGTMVGSGISGVGTGSVSSM